MNVKCRTAGRLNRDAVAAPGPDMTGINEAWSGSCSCPEQVHDIFGSKQTAGGELFPVHDRASIDA